MGRRRITLVEKKCERCGTSVISASRSILGLDDLKRAFGVLCSDCVTEEEENALLHTMAEGIIRKK